jgi:hypothetical protein|tara:strand:- start:147 stop:1862 length:1716 start_codon:yes stop_codon:yes gene_type:complete
MDVGGMSIDATNTVTGLLYGLANHKSNKAREYYFWRLCDELWNHEELPEPLMVKHPWAESMIQAVIQNKYVSIGGAASSGKSHTMAAWGILNWLAAPRDTLVLLTSTTLREARKRIWGSVISLLTVLEGAPFKIRDSIGNVAYVNENGTLIEKAGLSLIAAERSKTREAVGKFIGIKQKNVILIADELSELSTAILQAGLSNLSKNPSFSLVGLSNPASRWDAFGEWSEPAQGWDSIDPNIDETWKTKWGGLYKRYDGERSPNIIAGETVFPWLPTEEKIEEDKALLGQESRGYYRMVRAVFFDSDETDGVYTDAELVKSGAMGSIEWEGTPTPIAGCDPAFTNGGDRTILYTGHVGYDKSGQFVCQLGEAIALTDDATNKAVPRSYQIVQQIKDECNKRKILPANLGIDSTGAGSPLADILAAEFGDDILRVSFGGKASDKRVSTNSKLVGNELYVNRVTELWFVGKEFCRTNQLFGITNELAQEVVGRKYDMVKGSTLRMKLESKPDYKNRLGKSPDLADAAFICIDVARQRHGLVAVEPLDLGNKTQGSRRRRSIKQLTGVLTNQPLG